MGSSRIGQLWYLHASSMSNSNSYPEEESRKQVRDEPGWDATQAGLRIGQLPPDRQTHQNPGRPVAHAAAPWNMRTELPHAHDERPRILAQPGRNADDVFR